MLHYKKMESLCLGQGKIWAYKHSVHVTQSSKEECTNRQISNSSESLCLPQLSVIFISSNKQEIPQNTMSCLIWCHLKCVAVRVARARMKFASEARLS